MSELDLGFVLPQVFTETAVDMKIVQEVAQRAERAGFHSLWTQSQLIGTAAALEPLTLLSFAAGITERIRLGTSVIVVPEHEPVQLAKQLSSLDNISGGRLMVGLGLGATHLRPVIEGSPMDRPVRRLTETVGILSALWRDEPASFSGQLWRFQNLSMNPKPIQKPRPPIILSGKHPDAVRRSVKYGDGWMGAGGWSISQFGENVRQVRVALDIAERAESDFLIAKRLYVAVEDTKSKAEARLRERFASYSQDEDVAAQVSVFGSIDDVRAGVEEVRDLGAKLIVLNPVYDFLGQQDALTTLISESS